MYIPKFLFFYQFLCKKKTYHIYFSTSHNFYQNIYSRLYFPHFSNKETDTAKQSNFEKSRELTAADAEFSPSLYHLILLITKLYLFIFMYTYIQNIALGKGFGVRTDPNLGNLT